MKNSLLLIHSPLVGPSSLRPFEEAARAAGVPVALPDLTATVTGPRPHSSYIESAIAAAAGLVLPVAIVGHSGAGVFLPTIGDGVDEEVALVFVDAVVPPESGRHRTPEHLLAMLDQQTVDGALRRWLEWWPVDVVEQLLPDPSQREQLGADMPRVPRAFYDVEVEMPLEWSAGRCGYVRLSEAYDADHREAARRGWPTTVVDSNHLGVFSDPETVLAAVGEVVGRF